MPIDAAPDRRPVLIVASGAAAIGVGALAAVQSRANGVLATTFGSAIDAAVWSFFSGWVLLTLGLTHPSARAGLARAYRAYRADHLAWWQFLGGLGGGFFVATQSYVVPQVGVALFTIAVVGGQTTNALLVDAIGLGPAGRAPVTALRVLAALGTFVGVGVAMVARGGTVGSLAVGPVALAVLAGTGLAVQQAINGRVNRASGNVMATTWVNFTWGLGLLLGVLAAQVARGTWRPPVSYDAPAWTYAGGLLGILFVAVGAIVVHHLGVLYAALLTLAGQMVGAVVVDLLTPGGAATLTPLLLLGVSLTLISAIGAGIAARVASRRARHST